MVGAFELLTVDDIRSSDSRRSPTSVRPAGYSGPLFLFAPSATAAQQVAPADGLRPQQSHSTLAIAAAVVFLATHS